MAQDIHETLKRWWGYDRFRPLQEDIIRSVMDGRDTMALLPTGGGKSICFQVPAMAQEGICIVVSPLIALMKDQVENLNKKGIRAKAIYSGMSYREINYALDNCIHGDFKFLYLSPERLKSDLVLERIAQMPVNLLAVDEAHCISQWGYDFRPEYLQLAEVRKYLIRVPVIALTATATPTVVQDIQERMQFPKNNVFVQSFARSNISYVVNLTEDRDQRLLHILSKVEGTALVYVRNRRRAQDIAQMLTRNREKADYYHAGLPHEIRARKQNDWISGKTRIMACTNAFGMGIDKPDVRLVVHDEIPESPEAYYQEAGRAGRDGLRSWCVLLHSATDTLNAMSRFEQNYPREDDVRKVYSALCSYYAVPAGANPDRSFTFETADFCKKFSLSAILVHPALKILGQCGLISLSESFYEPSKVKILLSSELLYKFQVENPAYDDFIKLLLRSYGGLFDDYATISEKNLGTRGKLDALATISILQKLHQLQVLDYRQQQDAPQLTFTAERVVAANIDFGKALLKQRKASARERIDAMIEYAENRDVCRSAKLLDYFHERNAEPCGICDVCTEQRKARPDALTFEQMADQALQACKAKPMTLDGLMNVVPEENLVAVVRYLLDNDKLRYNQSGLLECKK